MILYILNLSLSWWGLCGRLWELPAAYGVNEAHGCNVTGSSLHTMFPVWMVGNPLGLLPGTSYTCFTHGSSCSMFCRVRGDLFSRVFQRPHGSTHKKSRPNRSGELRILAHKKITQSQTYTSTQTHTQSIFCQAMQCTLCVFFDTCAHLGLMYLCCSFPRRSPRCLRKALNHWIPGNKVSCQLVSCYLWTPCPFFPLD